MQLNTLDTALNNTTADIRMIKYSLDFDRADLFGCDGDPADAIQGTPAEYLGQYEEVANAPGDYIRDTICTMADEAVSAYSNDPYAWLRSDRDAVKYMEDCVNEGLYDPSYDYEFYRHVQTAQYMSIEAEINDLLPDALHALAYSYLQKAKKIESINRIMFDAIEALDFTKYYDEFSELYDDIDLIVMKLTPGLDYTVEY